MVTLYQGATVAPANPAQRITLIRPDGSRSEAWTAQGGYAGQPVVQFLGLNQAGTYRFGMADQSSLQPKWTSLTLGPGTQNLSVPLQLSGSALTVSDMLPAQANDFKFINGTWVYTVAWSNATAMQQDLALDVNPASLPVGWVVTFSPATLQAGQSSTMTVNYAEGCLTSTVSLQVRGRVGSSTVGLATKALEKNWTLTLLKDYGVLPPLSGAPYTVNQWWTVNLALGVRLVGTNLPVGAYANVNLPSEYVTTRSAIPWGGCGYNDAAYQQDAGPVAVLVNSSTFTVLNSPKRAWLNSGWNLHENFYCYTFNSVAMIESFRFKVRLGSTDLSFPETTVWPYY